MQTEVESLFIEDDGLYDSGTAGTYLGFKPTTLRNSRSTGTLAGVSSPAFVKLGTVVRYRGKTLKAWRDQFSEQLTTERLTVGDEI